MSAVKNQSILKGLVVSVVSFALIACGNSTSAVTPTTSSLAASDFSGSFVYQVNGSTGSDPNDGDYSVAGTFTADGKGNITSGVADYNLGSGIDANVALTGTYTASNGIATVNLTDGGSVQESYFVPIVKSGTATLTSYDGTGSGTLYAAATPTSAAAGTYAVSLSGEGDSTVTATAKFTTIAGGTFTGGTYSYTDGANLTTYNAGGAFFPVQASGRGIALIAGNSFSYYMASAGQIILLSLDDQSKLTGTATKQ